MKNLKKFEDIRIPIEVGDTILGGRFKNKKVLVKKIGKNAKGDITVNGKPLLKFRISKKANEEIIYSSMKYLKLYEEFNNLSENDPDDFKEENGRISMFDEKRLFELLPKQLQIIHTKGVDSQPKTWTLNLGLNKEEKKELEEIESGQLKEVPGKKYGSGDLSVDPVKISIIYSQNTPNKEGDVLADGEPDNLEFDIHILKDNDGTKANPDNLSLNVDITYGDAVVSSFKINSPNIVEPHDYTGSMSIVDPKTMFSFTSDSIKKLVEFFNRWDSKFRITPDNFKFLDTNKDSFDPKMDDENNNYQI
jgi:hypothetical protein